MSEYEDMCDNCVTPWKCNGPHNTVGEGRMANDPVVLRGAGPTPCSLQFGGRDSDGEGAESEAAFLKWSHDEDQAFIDAMTPPVNAEEVRVTASTGGQKGSKPERFDLIPSDALKMLARHYGKGAEKYERVNGLDNWRNGYPWSLSYAAMQRHLHAFWGGEDYDEETGSLHLVAAAWHCFTLIHFINNPRIPAEFDDRQDVWDRL